MTDAPEPSPASADQQAAAADRDDSGIGSDDRGDREAGHVPVMLAEVLEGLAPRPGMTVIDGTLGRGGHALRLLERTAPDGVLVGLDRDPAALAACEARLVAFQGRLLLRQFSYADLANVPVREEVRTALTVVAGTRDQRDPGDDGLADAILLDLGVSSPQLDAPDRGFGLRHTDDPLDLRFDPTAGATAADLIAGTPERDLADLLFNLGDERHSRRIAARLKQAARDGKMQTIAHLIDAIWSAMPQPARERARRDRNRDRDNTRAVSIHPATRTLLALRIAVNDELGALQRFIDALPDLLRHDGRCAIISFHSGEDRIVKHAFRALRLGRHFQIATSKPLVPTSDECRRNPRARSAKLRIIVRSAEPLP